MKSFLRNERLTHWIFFFLIACKSVESFAITIDFFFLLYFLMIDTCQLLNCC